MSCGLKWYNASMATEREFNDMDSILFRMERTFEQYESKMDAQTIPIPPSHYHVGGTIADRIGRDTIPHINPIDRTWTLENEKPTTFLRSDLSVKDADTFVIYPDAGAFHLMREEFTFWHVPLISVEPTPFSEWSHTHPKWTHFVSGMEVGAGNRLFLTMQYMKEEISWKSVEPWRLRLQSGVEISTLNPFVYLFRYAGRSPSGIKPKDAKALGTWIDAAEKQHKFSKLSLMGRLAVETLKAGREQGIDYLGDEYFGPWAGFLHRIHNNPDPLTHAYAYVTDWFWKGPGTAISHGKGPLGFLVSMQDRMGA